MGRLRKPTAVLAASGAFAKNPARGRARANEPKPTGPIGGPPDWLNKKERVCWSEIVSGAAPGVLTSSDTIAIAAACVLYAAVKARKATASEFNQLRQYLSQFAMTPASRNNVSVSPEISPQETALQRAKRQLRDG